MNKRVNELNLERAKTLLGKEKISEEKLKQVLERIKAFCKVAYQLYSKKNPSVNEADNVRQLYSEPPDQFKNAA